MTQITLRLASIGDIHNNQTNLAKIQTYLTAAKNAGKLDFFIHPGDMSSSSSSSSQMSACKAKFDAVNTPYFVSCGNHDVSGNACYSSKSNGAEACGSCNFKTVFGYCHKITTFNKSGQDFQVVIPGILWSGSAYWKIDLAAASKTLPTIVVNHGPLMKPAGIPGCGAWDSLHTYAFSLKSGVDSLKTMVTYSGHVHEACVSPTGTDVTPTANTLYVVQDAVGSSRCSSAENNFIGYTKITYETTTGVSTKRYKKVNYTTAFVDPFPDVGPITLTSITVSPSNISVNMGGTGQLTATCKDQNGNTMTCPSLSWSSGDTSKVTVNSTGKITGVAIGTANVKAVSGTVVSNVSIVTVTLSPALTSIIVTPANMSVSAGGTGQLTATCKDQNGNTITCPGLSWISSDLTKVTVDATGKVTGIAAGTANVTAKSGIITSNASGITVTSAPVLTSIVVTPATAPISINGTIQLTATCKDQNNNTMTCPGTSWASSDPTKATVNSTGVVTGVTTGMANITTTANSGSIVSNSSAITVSAAPNAIVVTTPSAGLVYLVGESRVVRWAHTSVTGANVKIELLRSGVVIYTTSSSTPNDNAFAWTVPSIASSNGYQVRITDLAHAQYVGISGNFTIQGSIPLPVLTSIVVAPGTASINVSGSVSLSTTCKDQNGTTMTCTGLSWTSSDTSKVTVDSTGKVTGIAAGTANITAKSGTITSNASVITVTQPVENKFSVYDVTPDTIVNNAGILAVLDPTGTLTKDEACVEICNRLGLI